MVQTLTDIHDDSTIMPQSAIIGLASDNLDRSPPVPEGLSMFSTPDITLGTNLRQFRETRQQQNQQALDYKPPSLRPN